ncbi:LOW QUALITY PROTEIN: PIN2/TERF1-interacting telomerase inhibitor 1 [Drosophila tropicalis]|uniref:LOW QUALITY PROTEIN: PIN2/TERF1-interacting telomerase inhibitor 1 n=1 Tax=Drosophila tropicalis TaxID=46794 RepID=UPI0035AC0FB3
MAMLAEPRRRKRYNLCPRGKALYEDDNRFGTKMLEKMGWSKGRGLGANEDGQQEFVRVRFKNDAEGLGFEARDDQWTTHEEGFNGLLKALNGEASEGENAAPAPASEEDEARPAFGFGFKTNEADPAPTQKNQLKEKISGISLEERSKESKARVHYKKFTRGKDLSQYSEKDLANIFGKKATDDTEQTTKEATPPPPEKKDTDPNFAGVQTLSTGLSVQDYFKHKMEAMKNRIKNNSNTTPLTNGNEEQKDKEIVEEKPVEVLPKKKKKKKDKERELAEELEINEEATPKKKKKSKKSNKEKEETKENYQELDDETTTTKKKKNKDKIEKNVEIIPEESAKKKKKKKDKPEIEDVKIIKEIVSEESSKKRKRSKIEIEVNELEEDTKSSSVAEEAKQNVEDPVEEPPLKKRKKSKKNKNELVEELLTKDDEIKKTKKRIRVADDCPTEETEVIPKKKKKKSKKEDKTNGDVLPTDSVSAAISSGDMSDSLSTEPEDDDYLAKQKLQEELKSFDIVKISSFCAEQFQLFNMSAYTNATLHEIPGYGCSENLQLEVEDNEFDKERLINLWNNTSSTLYKKTKRAYPKLVKPSTVRAVKKKTVFAAV